MINLRSLGLAVTLAVFTACGETPTSPHLLGPSLMGTADRTVKMVPFQASHSTLPGDASGVVCAADNPGLGIGDGKGTHLGKYTVVVNQCFNPISGIWSRLDGTFVAADGDELHFEMDAGGARVIFFDPSTLDFISAGGLDVTGGTGRFEGATGHLNFRGTGNVLVPGAFITTTGEISSPGSIKWGTP